MLRRLKKRLGGPHQLSKTPSVQPERSEAEQALSTAPQGTRRNATMPTTPRSLPLPSIPPPSRPSSSPPSPSTSIEAPSPLLWTTRTKQTPDVSAASTSKESHVFAANVPPTTPDNCSYVSNVSRQAVPSKPPSVRIIEQCRLNPHTDNAVSAAVDCHLPEGKTYLTLGATSFHLAAVGRVVVTPGSSQQTAVRLLNLNNRPVDIYAGTVVAALIPAERAVRRQGFIQPHEGIMPSVNYAAISHNERGRLAALLAHYRHVFAKDANGTSCAESTLPGKESKRPMFVEHNATNDLPTYLAECRPARDTFPFPTEACAVQCTNVASWNLALPYADRHIPRRFHAVLQLPTELHLPSTATKARYVNTLTPLHRKTFNALPLYASRRLVALCTTAFDQLVLPPGYAQSVADLETHISCVMVVYAPAIFVAAQDAADPRLNQYLELIDKSGLRLDVDHSLIGAAAPEMLIHSRRPTIRTRATTLRSSEMQRADNASTAHYLEG